MSHQPKGMKGAIRRQRICYAGVEQMIVEGLVGTDSWGPEWAEACNYVM
jgi:hypothetical protein